MLSDQFFKISIIEQNIVKLEGGLQRPEADKELPLSLFLAPINKFVFYMKLMLAMQLNPIRRVMKSFGQRSSLPLP